MKKLTPEQVLEKANVKHNFEYEYPNIEKKYKTTKIKIDIFHKKCENIFQQRPDMHLSGQGCPFCFKPFKDFKKTNEIFLIEANKKHLGKYEYPELKYVSTDIKINILCTKCNKIFQQTPHNHLKGHGCPYCVGRCQSFNELEIKMNKKHNSEYEYPNIKTEYKNNEIKITIFHKRCGKIFQQTPHMHLQGKGCSYCHGGVSYTNEIFLQESEKKGLNQEYEYPNLNYINSKIKINILHKKCNKIYKQSPSVHLRGDGCPYCGKRISMPESKWLNNLNIKESFLQKKIIINDKVFYVDAFDSETNTIYEFLGDYWHGNINNPKFSPNKVHPNIGLTYQELYNKTMNKIEFFKENNFNVIYIWEYDWRKSV